MAGSPKLVCFITSVIIAWGISEVLPLIFAWFDNRINGTEILYSQVIFCTQSLYMYLILLQGVLLHGVRKENSKFIEFWLVFWSIGFLELLPWGLYIVSIYPVILQLFQDK